MKNDFTDITVRPALKSEYPLIRQLAEKIWPETYAGILSDDQLHYMIEMMYSQDVMLEEAADHTRFRLVLRDEQPVGFAAWGPYLSEPPVAKLHKLYLDFSCHGQGIGSYVIGKVKAEARAAGFAFLRLSVNRQNDRAVKCYERNGFQLLQKGDFDIGHGYFMNDFVMEAEL